MTKTRLQAIINAILSVRSALSDADALNNPSFFPEWSADKSYPVDDRVLYGGTLYKCLQPHTAQPTWTPADAPSLWVWIDDPAIEWPEWIQPAGSTDAYPIGAKVSHNGRRWVSTVDGNVWEPDVYGWNEVTNE